MIQHIQSKTLNRKDHVWFRLPDGRCKCCICGGIVAGPPPQYPTPGSWIPDSYELPLTEAERKLAPNPDTIRRV